jgi:hypothetical protein
MAPRRVSVARGALLATAAAALASGARAFDTALGGSSAEQATFTTLGAGALELAPPLTTIDPDVRADTRAQHPHPPRMRRSLRCSAPAAGGTWRTRCITAAPAVALLAAAARRLRCAQRAGSLNTLGRPHVAC